MPKEITIKLNEQGDAFAARYPGSVKITRQPAGLDFYGMNWNPSAPGIIRFEHGRNTVSIDHVLSLQTAQDVEELKKEGFRSFSVNSGITEPELISHDEARTQTYALLGKLLEQGWRSRYYADDPRLMGKERLAHVIAVTNSIGLDPAYMPSLQEWMSIPTRSGWMLYANGVFLDISFTRERTLTDATKLGSYLLTYTIQSETNYFRGYVESEERLKWKEKLPATLPKLAAIRAQREAELKAKGVPIDETYVDPPLPALN